jgi:hypothetical protein
VRAISLSALLLWLSTMSTGCLVLALQPAYDTESVVFEEALIGEWENTDDGAKATIARGEWRSYRVTYTDRFASRAFQGNLTRIGAATYLDLTEMRGADPGPYLVPVHGLLRITLANDGITAAMLEYGWFTRAMLQKSPGRPALALDDRRNVVMTAPSGELRRWLQRAPSDAFGAPMTFVRKS